MNRWLPVLYRKKGKEKGIPDAIIENAIKYAEKLHGKDLPVILSLNNLSFYTDVKYSVLRKNVKRKIYAYHDFRIRKRQGGYRIISVPNKDLTVVQKWIDRYILTKFSAGPNSFAFETGKKIKGCALYHLGCKWLIKVDIKNFFASISEKQIYKVFLEFGYSQLVAFELARLCTKTKKNKSHHSRRSRYKFYYDERIGFLPQGASTSPKLSNAVLCNFDKEISSLLDNRVVYTRYADDLIFSSSDEDFKIQDAKKIINKVIRILYKYDFEPNKRKIQIIHPGARKIVLGLLVDGDKIRLPKDFRQKLECHLYYCKKDANGHSERRGFRSVLGLKNYVNGLLAHAKNIDPEYYATLVKKELIPLWPI